MRKAIAILAAGLTCSAGLPAAAARTKKAAHPKTAASAPNRTGPARRTRRRPSAHAVKQSPARSAHSAPSRWRPGQTAPTPDRYREIQGALAKKGYLHGEATGVWNQDSADALRRFQQDQNLQASGKLDSLSIVALGLGPKY